MAALTACPPDWLPCEQDSKRGLQKKKDNVEDEADEPLDDAGEPGDETKRILILVGLLNKESHLKSEAITSTYKRDNITRPAV